ncbi:MAG: hypothetical protein AAFZ07_26780 [Actinomycetota bacterium]
MRDRTIEVPHTEPVTARALVDGYVADVGLPLRTVDRELIAYELLDPATERVLDPDELIEPADDDLRFELRSPEAATTWQEISSLVDRIETELRGTARAELEGAVTERVEGVRGWLRTETSRRIRGAVTHLDWRARRRVRTWTRQIGATEALPDQVEDISLLVRRLGPLAGGVARVAVPLVGGAAVATAGAGVYAAVEDDPTAEEIAAEVEELLDDPTDGADGADGDEGDDLDIEVAAAIDVDELADAVAERLPTVDRLSAADLEVLLAALVERDPATGPILGGLDPEPPTQLTAAGGSLWEIASSFRDDPAGCASRPPYEESIGRYVLRVWAANIDGVGSDPDDLEIGTELRMPCPR